MRFCIVGTGRCGSTLLQKMLNSHPEIFVFNETHWIPKMYEFFGKGPASKKFLFDVLKRTKHVTQSPTTQLSERLLEKSQQWEDVLTVKQFCNHIGEYYAQENNKSYWADKTPDYGYFLATLQSLWPDCKIIHIVRDGVAVINSMSRHIGYQTLAKHKQIFWCPLSFDYCQPQQKPAHTEKFSPYIELWYWRLKRTIDESSRLVKDSYVEIRYEDLTQNPNRVLAEICKFVALKQTPSWLESASGLVDSARGKKSCHSEIIPYLRYEEKQLLNDMGYFYD